MTTPFITVACITIRSNPHLDWAIEGLMQQTFTDFEYIVVDGKYNDRPNYVKDLVAKYNPKFKVRHVPDKISKWNGKRPALCSARNTVYVYADGEYIAFCDDNCIIPSNWLERHAQFGKQNYSVAGNWITFQTYDYEKKTGDVGPYGLESSRKYITTPTVMNPFPTGPAWLYGGNMGFPLQAALDVNGSDEIMDGEQGNDDCLFNMYISRKGYKVIYDPKCLVYYVLKDHTATQLEADVKHEKKDWKIEKGMENHPKERILKHDHKLHFSNEYIIQQAHIDEHLCYCMGNMFSLVDLRKQFRETGKIEHELGSMYDWRDGARIV